MLFRSKRMHYVLCCSASYLPAAIISITAVRRLLLVQQADRNIDWKRESKRVQETKSEKTQIEAEREREREGERGRESHRVEKTI